MAGLTIARPDAAIALARPVGLRFCELRRQVLFFFGVGKGVVKRSEFPLLDVLFVVELLADRMEMASDSAVRGVCRVLLLPVVGSPLELSDND